MKRFFTTIVLAAMIIIAGCTDLDDVQRQLDELKDRLKSAEQHANNVNSEIASIRVLIDAMNEKVSMVSYKELADKSGYELTLSDGGKITLKHGAKGDDGITPEINVKQHSDGLLYWTINGNFLFDSNGNKVVAQGFTPQLRVNSEFHWEMSLDGGTTWQLVKDDKGNPVAAQGPKGDDGDADLTITEVGDVIIITYKGVTYTLPKGEAPVMMILTTTKNVGHKIEIFIDAADEDQPHVWIDLNNNGIKESGEAVYFGDYRAYTIGTQTVTIYGKITWLECSDNDLKVLDVSNNTSLTWLDCSDNDLKVLDVSNNTSLTWLNCSDNNLKVLDVSKNTSLAELYCYNNQLPALNVGNNAALTSLGCNGNLITELDVSHNAALEDLFCSNNQLQKLSVIENIKLRMLFCNNNQLTALDVSNNPNLCNLRCYNNKISGDNMIALVNSLPIRTAGDEGIFRVIDLTNPEEQNVCTTAQVGIATGKNWKVLNSDGDPYPGS
jgi:Leucine-rich repeat (LRR) protein